MPAFRVLVPLLSAVLIGIPAFARPEDSPPDSKSGARPVQTTGKTPQQLFEELDKNHDGKVTADEVPADGRANFSHLIRVADKDKDGALTRTEFVEGLTPVERPQPTAPPTSAATRGEVEVLPIRPPGEVFTQLDRNGDGKLTIEEIPEAERDGVRRVYSRLGKTELTRDEFVQAARMINSPLAGLLLGGPASMPLPPPAQTFAQLDRNGDGKLSLEEIPEPQRERMRPLLARLGKTELTREEYVQAIERMRAAGGGMLPGAMDPRPVAVLFRKLDKDNDGKLTREEWSKAPELFDELDADKSGSIDRRELQGPPPEFLPGTRPPQPPGEKAAEKATDPSGKAASAGSTAPASKPAPEPAKPDAKPTTAEVRGQLRRFDGNGDGRLSRDEAQGRLKNNFDRLDTDGNGYLEAAELLKALQDMKAGKAKSLKT